MDVIESSHFEVVKNWLLIHQRHEFKVRSYGHDGSRFWEFRIYDNVSHNNFLTFTGMSFGSGLKGLSKLISQHPGAGTNGSNG